MFNNIFHRFFIFLLLLLTTNSYADENLLGYVKGAETLPAKSWEIYQIFTSRRDKGYGKYQALDSKTLIEYGLTHRFTLEGSLQMQSIETKNLRVDGYLPKDHSSGFTPSGLSLGMKYNFLSPAMDDWGLSSVFELSYSSLDPHSGQGKDKKTMELEFILQKYFLEGEVIGVANLGFEMTHADRERLYDLPNGFDWPTEAEMEIGLKLGLGLSYRFMPNWFLGLESLYETEYETEVNQERWTIFAGPSLHYGSQRWWTTITWFPQWSGGGEMFPEQDDDNLHLIEKTKSELRLKLGYNF